MIVILKGYVELLIYPQVPDLKKAEVISDERKRQQRRRVGFAGGATIVIAAIVVIALVAFGVHKAVTGGSSTPPRAQTTVLLQVEGSNGSAVASALLAHDTNVNQGVEVLIPPRVSRQRAPRCSPSSPRRATSLPPCS